MNSVAETNAPKPGAGRALVLIPTYNERDNIPKLVPLALVQDPCIDLLIIDDNSPDGTGALADEIAETEPRVRVLHRPGKLGLGTAYIAGFRQAIELGYDFVVEMDADFSHDPAHLPQFLSAAQQAIDVRGYADFVPMGGSVVPLRSTDSIMWTVKFRNGMVKRFKFPCRTTPEGKADPTGGFANDPALDDTALFTEPQSLRLQRVWTLNQ